MDEKRCFAVASGNYSDYTIHAIFSRREAAEAFMAAFDWGGCSYERIEEFPFDSDAASYCHRLTLYAVRMTDEGDTQSVMRVQKPKLPEEIGNGGWFRPAPEECHVWARDETHAVKIVNELRAGWLALRDSPGWKQFQENRARNEYLDLAVAVLRKQRREENSECGSSSPDP